MTVLDPVSICNQALDMIGHKGRRIGSLYDGLPASIVALETYAETRDELLSALKPEWAYRDIVLTLLATSPGVWSPPTIWSETEPPLPWLYEYAWPSDCIQPLQIKDTPYWLPVWKPAPKVFRIYSRGHEPITGDNRSIVTNVPQAILVYIGQVLNPNVWQENFTLKLITTLAEKFRTKLGEPVAKPADNTSGRGEPGAR